MIVVSLKKSYPNLIDDVSAGSEMMPLFRLEGITRGDWPKMSDELIDGYLDFVVGVYDGMIVTAYGIGSVARDPDGTIRFTAPEGSEQNLTNLLESRGRSNKSDDPAEWLVGCPIPGGPWKQGEARGTRRYALSDYMDDHPELRSRLDEDWGSRMATNLLDHFAKGKPIDTNDYPQLAAATATTRQGQGETNVTVVRQPGGTVIVTIPTGTRAQILIDPENAA